MVFNVHTHQEMVHSSQEVLIEAPRPSSDEGILLAGAFSDFIAASSRLELSYRDLQAEVAELSQALSERNRALSESLSRNEAMGDRLQRILEVIPCGVLVLAGDGCVQLANPEAVRLLGLSAERGSLERSSIPQHPGLRLQLHDPIFAQDEEEQEICVDGAGGPSWIAVRRVHLSAAWSPVTGSTEAVFTLRDVSARKRMEREREAARDAVALAQVSALLAHEIRNPLASLELFAGLLGEGAEGHDEWLSHLRAGIRSLSGIVNNVLTLHGNTPLTLGPVDVVAEAAMAVDFLQPMARQARVNLQLVPGSTSASEAGKTVQANRGALHQILTNLCVNALRHTPADGVVKVTYLEHAMGSGMSLLLGVTDTGSGIHAEHLPHIFEVGFSGSGATSGLGLAVCDRLARQMGGAITVRSHVGQGSTFTLELPLA